MADSGLDTTHPLVQSFSGSSYVGGNFLSAYSADFGQNPNDGNVDERQPVRAPAGTEAACVMPASHPTCLGEPSTNGFDCMVGSFVGHGTHTFGLLGANRFGASSDAMQGTCRHCGIGLIRVARTACVRIGPADFAVASAYTPTATPPAITAFAQSGAQVVNLSLADGLPDGYCDGGATHPYCVALAFLDANDVLLTASSGNHRADIQFSAADERVVSVGGIDETGTFWDESPGSQTNCPFYNPNTPGVPANEVECGSNYTRDLAKRFQEFVAPAKNVRSTFHRDATWNARLSCGDLYGDSSADGIGLCTGTSMSAPIVAGVMGLLRSINPLVPKGDPASSVVYGVRNAVRDTTDRALAGMPSTERLGYGSPRAVDAAARMLGKVRGDIVENRLTPLFTLYSAGGLDFASVATPQSAVALIRYSSASYSTATNPVSPTTPGYSAFPTELPAPPVPRANAYVLTTERTPMNGVAPVPLYWLDRARPWPLGCSLGQPGCAFYHRDSILVASTAHVEAAVADGYAFRGRQGYIYPRCPGDAPSCKPAGTERMYRLCKTADDDCAVFLESQFGAYQALGYTSVYPAGADSVVGYAYPNVDSDGDGLVDGLERIIGTNWANPTTDKDSDDDGVQDGVEFPQAGVSLSDPCVGPNVTCNRLQNVVFANSFE